MSRRGLLGAGLFLAVTIAAFESTAVITALPTIVDDLGGRSLYGATLAANFLANLVAIVAAGEAADRRGPARPFAICAVLFVTGLLVTGVAPSMIVVVAGRALQGGGIGGFGALAYVGVRRGFPDDGQARMYAVLSAGWVLPSLAAPFLAGTIVDRFGWRWVFLAMVPPAVIVSGLAVSQLRHLPLVEPRPDGEPRPASLVPTSARLTVGAGMVLGGLPSAHWYVAGPLVIGGLVVGVPALQRLLPNGWHRAARGVPAVIACRLAVTFAFNGVDSFVPLAADRIHHATATVQGATIMGSSLTWSLGQIVAARLHGRVAPHRMIGVGSMLLGLGGALVIPVVSASTPLWVTFLCWAVGGLGMGLLFNSTTTFAMTSTDERTAGRVSGQISMADSLGYATVGGIGGAIVALSERGTIALTTALVITFAISVAAAAVAVVASRRVV